MIRSYSLLTLAACASLVLGTAMARAQVATTIEQAELAGLSPAMKAEVQARMAKGGQTVSEILQTELLNNIKVKHPASSIVALDFARGAAVVKLTSGQMEVVPFDTRTLAVNG